MAPTRKILRFILTLTTPGLLVVACGDDPQGLPRGGPATGFSAAYDQWAPGPYDTCTREHHNEFSVVGPDGLLYPTWHPPIDPETGCMFGHEHGRDPQGSNLYPLIGDLPFGLALPAPHVGYKIEWENGVDMHFSSDAASSLLEVTCDVMMELHQGSSGAGSFSNNMHEIAIHARCSDETRVHLTMIAAIGHPGEFIASCDRERAVVVVSPPPAGAPDGGGRRIIPDRACIEEHILVPDGERSDYSAGVRESWEVSDRVRTVDGHTLVSFNPYFQVLFPSRYHDPAAETGLARTLGVCFETGPNGERAEGGPCDESRQLAMGDGSLSWDDPRSAFRGARRFVDVNTIRISNADGPEFWYTDRFGKNARPDPFPGSIRQFIARVDNERASMPSGPAIGRDRDYGTGWGVHAPN